MIRTSLSVIALLAALASPGPARAEDATVKVTFRLTLRGDVPPTQSFSGYFFLNDSDDGIGILYCGTFVKTVDLPPCVGGRSYEGDSPGEGYAVPVGTIVRYNVVRYLGPSGGSGGDEIARGARRVMKDVVIQLSYDYGDGTMEDADSTPTLPSTGGGGSAR